MRRLSKCRACQNPEHHIEIKTLTYLPARDNSEIHGCFNVGIARRLELLALIANNVTESLDSSGVNRHFRANELAPVVDGLRERLVLTEPKAPVERLYTLVAALSDLMDRRKALVRMVGECKLERDGDILAVLIH